MNFSVVVTTNGQDLVDVFRQSPDAYDLIITDVMMPIMNGLEAAREIKKIKKINIVALTAYEQDVRILDRNGDYIPWTICDYILHKPLHRACLLDILSIIDYDNYKNSQKNN